MMVTRKLGHFLNPCKNQHCHSSAHSTCPQLFDQPMPSHSSTITIHTIPIPTVNTVINLVQITIPAVILWYFTVPTLVQNSRAIRQCACAGANQRPDIQQCRPPRGLPHVERSSNRLCRQRADPSDASDAWTTRNVNVRAVTAVELFLSTRYLHLSAVTYQMILGQGWANYGTSEPKVYLYSLQTFSYVSVNFYGPRRSSVNITYLLINIA